jgi:sporulation protein YlmC with PRC-barrel domain
LHLAFNNEDIQMLRSVKELYGYFILASDGEIGRVNEFYFDDEEWVIRYLLVDIGKWLSRQRVLISPAVLGKPNQMTHLLPVILTREQVNNCPDIDQDKPVSRQPKIEYWPGLGIPTRPGVAGLHAAAQSVADKDEGDRPDPHLRSTREVTGYYIQARDGQIGHVKDFIVDDETWIIRYLVVNTRNWVPGKKVLVAPRWVDRVSWLGSKVFVDLPRVSIKDNPEYDPLALEKRVSERHALEYHGWPKF